MFVKYSQIILFCVCMHIALIEFSELSRTRLLKALPVYQFLSRTQVLIFSKYEMVEQV